MKRFSVLFLVCTILIPSHAAHAGWVLDGTSLGGRGYAYASGAVSDGAGGAIVAWTELRGADEDVFARRIDLNGNPLWTTDGVPVCTAVNDQTEVHLIADGAGGVIITWRDTRSGEEDVYAQRLNANGAAMWAANGVAICTFAGTQAGLSIVSDGSQGAIIAWQDARSGTNWDIYARRINSAGAPQWTANGNAVCTLASGQTGVETVPDGSGGVLIAWLDFRNGAIDVFAQRLNSAGTAQWALNGLSVCVSPGDQGLNSVAPDGSGGMLLAWYDERNGTKDIYAHRINASGAPVWTANGVAVCTATDEQGTPMIVGDGSGGAIIAWDDYRNGADLNTYAQHLTAFGVPTWQMDGVALCTAAGSQSLWALVGDGASGAIALWQDPRTGTEQDVYARRIDAAGFPQWNYDGVPVCTAPYDQGGVYATGDGAGGVIAAWSDGRSGVGLIYAQRIEWRYGYWGRPEPTIRPAKDNPNDQGGQVLVRWFASQRDAYDQPAISHYSIWRSTDAVAFAAARRDGASRVLTDPRGVARDQADPLLWKEETLSGPVYWEWIDNLPAVYQPSYSYLAPTRQDSTVVDPATTYFKIVSHESAYPQTRAWESATVSARSVDNVAPAAPLMLAIRASGTNAVLTWNSSAEPDFARYTLYRAGANGVRAIAANFLAHEVLTNFTDNGAAAGGYFYVITASDTHGNESATSNEVSLTGSTDVGDTPAITALTLQPNFPNPFSTRTELNIGVAAAGEAVVELFDVAGRRVLQRSLGTLDRGWRKVTLDGVDAEGRPLASGVYLCRVAMNGQRATGKIAIAR